MIHVVLYEPEIPQNTGNIMRTCMAFNMKLHLIEPIGFMLDEKHLRRASMDYIERLDYNTYKNYEEFSRKDQTNNFKTESCDWGNYFVINWWRYCSRSQSSQ